jgi:hypothetical protein
MDTGLYLNGPASWGDCEGEALRFENSIAALEFCVTERLHDVEILLLLNDSQKNRPLRLFPRSTVGPAVRCGGRVPEVLHAEARA